MTINSVANIFVRQMHFLNAGDIEHGHTHQFDHLTHLSSGRLMVTVNGKSTEFVAPHMIFITKDKQHELVALEDNTVVCCIHALRDGPNVGDIIDPASVPAGVRLVDLAKPLM